jgi:hypothetical protein
MLEETSCPEPSLDEPDKGAWQQFRTWCRTHRLTAVLLGIILVQQVAWARMVYLLDRERVRCEQVEERLLQERRDRQEKEDQSMLLGGW